MGRWRVRLRIPGTPELVVRLGVEAIESPDGSRLFVLSHEDAGQLSCQSLNGGQACRVPHPSRIEPGCWGCARDGLYYVIKPRPGVMEVYLLPYGQGVPTKLAVLDSEAMFSFSLAWDGRRMFWTSS